jgi:CubicO group peptidase (beta-lactamase class C family)
VDLGTLLRLPYTEIATPGAGSVFSTASDMARYVGWITSGGGGVLDPLTLAEMCTVQFTIGQGDDMGDMGYAFIVVAGPPRKIWHNGGWPGASTAMWTAPDRGLGVFLHSNTLPHQSNLDALASELVGKAADAYGQP